MLLAPCLSCWGLPELCPSARFHSKFVGTDNIEKEGLKKKNEEKREREKKKATRGLRATSLERSCYQGN